MEEVSILHLVLRATCDDLMLQLELDDGDGLMHLSHELDTLLIVGLISVPELRSKGLAGILAIYLHR